MAKEARQARIGSNVFSWAAQVPLGELSPGHPPVECLFLCGLTGPRLSVLRAE